MESAINSPKSKILFKIVLKSGFMIYVSRAIAYITLRRNKFRIVNYIYVCLREENGYIDFTELEVVPDMEKLAINAALYR